MLKKFFGTTLDKNAEDAVVSAQTKRQDAATLVAEAKSKLRSASDELLDVDVALAERMKAIQSLKNGVQKEMDNNDDHLDALSKVKL